MGVNDHFAVHVGGDTTVNGQPCKKLIVSGAVIGYPATGFAYVVGDKVYAYSPDFDTFQKAENLTLFCSKQPGM